MGQESLIRWDRSRWLDGTEDIVYGSGEFDRMEQEKVIWWDRRSCIWVRRVCWDGTGEDDLMGQKSWCTSKQDNFWQQMSHFYSCEEDCYQNCKVIVTKNLRWYYHLTMDEKWPNYRGMAAQYWMSHQYCLVFYFWCRHARWVAAVSLAATHAAMLPLIIARIVRAACYCPNS